MLPSVLQPLHDAEELLNRAAQSEKALPGTFPPPFHAKGQMHYCWEISQSAESGLLVITAVRR